MQTAVEIELNGEKRQVPDGITIARLLAEMGVSERGIAVERNRELVPRSQLQTCEIQAGDRLEIVGFIGGG